MSDADEHEIRPGPVTPGRQQEAIFVRRTRGSSELNQKLKAIGDRLRPPTTRYIGSIGIHLYISTEGTQFSSITQDALGDATAFQANFGLQQASFEIAKAYGWKPPATRTDVMKRDPHRGGLIVPGNLASPDAKDET